MNKKEKIKVLHIITRLDPGGSAENTVLSVEKVDSELFESEVWTGLGLESKGISEEYNQRLAGKVKLLPKLVRNINPVTDFFALIDLSSRLRKEKPDILHLHSAKAGVLGRIAARMSVPKCKVIYTPHGHVFSGYGGESANRIFTTIEKFLASWCHAIVGLTADEIREFEAHNAGQREQFCIIPSGVELKPFLEMEESQEEIRKEFGLKADDEVVGFFGRFEEVKGPDRFIEVVRIIHQKRPDVKFLIVGDGSMKKKLHETANKYNFDSSLIWTGWRNDIPRLMKALDVFVLTSRNEGQGRVLVEAMASETAIVAMTSGGVGEVINQGTTGLLTESGDIEATAYAVTRLLGNPKRKEAMGQHGREDAIRKFSVEEMIRRLEKLYKALLNEEFPSDLFR